MIPVPREAGGLTVLGAELSVSVLRCKRYFHQPWMEVFSAL